MNPIHDALLLAVRQGIDLNVRQIVVLLEAVEAKGIPVTVRGLAAHLQVSKPAITRAVDRLEELNWAVRRVDPEDRRSVLIYATEEGRKHARRLFDAGGLLAQAA
jgi:DNA-binding MarR family transcriptional regulator